MTDLVALVLFFIATVVVSYRFCAMHVFKTMPWLIAEGEVDGVYLQDGTWSHVSIVRFVDGRVMRLRGNYRKVCLPGMHVRITRRVLGGYDLREVEPKSLAP